MGSTKGTSEDSKEQGKMVEETLGESERERSWMNSWLGSLDKERSCSWSVLATSHLHRPGRKNRCSRAAQKRRSCHPT